MGTSESKGAERDRSFESCVMKDEDPKELYRKYYYPGSIKDYVASDVKKYPDKLSRWNRNLDTGSGKLVYEGDAGYDNSNILDPGVCARHEDSENPDDYFKCIKKHTQGCHKRFREYKSKTIQAAANARAAFAEWKSISDPNFLKTIKENRIKNAITNEKLKMNAILAGSWADYQNLHKLYKMQSATLNDKFRYHKYQQDLLNNYQKDLEKIISDININRHAENLKYNAKVKYTRQIILSRFLLGFVLLTLILIILLKWREII